MVRDPRDASQRTREYLDSLLIEMRHLDGVTPDTQMQFLGKSFPTPVMIAAFSHLDSIRPNGMVEMAKGAQMAGAVNWAGMGEESELEQILQTGAATVKIVKPYADRALMRRRLEHACQAGALAVGVDIDHGFDRFGRPDKVLGMDMLPMCHQELWEIVRATPLPFVVKGVLSVQDALKCRDCGVKAIVVSHHHGIMPYALPPLQILPDIVQAVGKDMEIVVDCGIATGADAFKALALGAGSVCVGRAILPSLRDEGAEGVRDYLNAMTDELRGILARTGSRDIYSIDPSVIWHDKA